VTIVDNTDVVRCGEYGAVHCYWVEFGLERQTVNNKELSNGSRTAILAANGINIVPPRHTKLNPI
jgi:hypothetical protein